MRPLRIFTWHVHGSYLFYLAHARQDFFLPVKPDRPPGYNGRTSSYPWPANVHEVPVEEVRRREFDCVLYQSHDHYLEDQYEVLSESQRRLPRIFLEHDPPRQTPTDTRHPVDDPNVLIVHVTHFNDLMWDSGRSRTRVIEHGVVVPDGIRHTGERPRGLAVVNNLRLRGRRLGADVFDRLRRQFPLDLVGMGWQEAGGLREVPHRELAAFSAPYRFFFNPIRYTSLGLAVCEAMMIGMPILGLATTEMVGVVQNGISGYLETDVRRLADHIRRLLHDPLEARQLGDGAWRTARERFAIDRFARDWDETFSLVAGRPAAAAVTVPRSPARAGEPA
jgi:glycosyltransferase involved in cell wall biosynthesis